MICLKIIAHTTAMTDCLFVSRQIGIPDLLVKYLYVVGEKNKYDDQ
jgi:hypothetical protein